MSALERVLKVGDLVRYRAVPFDQPGLLLKGYTVDHFRDTAQGVTRADGYAFIFDWARTGHYADPADLDLVDNIKREWVAMHPSCRDGSAIRHWQICNTAYLEARFVYDEERNLYIAYPFCTQCGERLDRK